MVVRPTHIYFNAYTNINDIQLQSCLEFGSSGSSKYDSVTIGEQITDIKQLCQRTTDFMAVRAASTTSNNVVNLTYVGINGIPWATGYYASADLVGSSNSIQVGYDYEYVFTPYAVQFMYMYCGHRGDFDWSFTNIAQYSSCTRIKVYRAAIGKFVNATSTLTAAGLSNKAYITNSDSGNRGSAITTTTVSGAIAVKSPYYSNLLFHTCDPRYRDGRTADDSNVRGLYVESLNSAGSTGSIAFVLAVSASENWEPLYFLNVPKLYILVALP